MQTAELIQAHDRWREEGKALREKLVAERDELSARLKELDRRLAEMPPSEAASTHATKRESQGSTFRELTDWPAPSPDDSLSEVIRTILRGAPDAMSASEIIEIAQKFRKIDRRASVHSILNQFKNKGLVLTQERDGWQHFLWSEKKAK